MLARNFGFALALCCLLAGPAASEPHPTAPALNSRPGAAYTMYLNFSGFNYPGSWAGETPGVVSAYNNQSGATFTPAEQAGIKNIWARVAEAYAPFNVNVTTVDPAAAAGQAGTDALRLAYYDATPRVMHTIIGSPANGSFFSGAGGVSEVDVWDTAQTNGMSTNWVFWNRYGAGSYHNIYTATAHENGHAAGLWHQGDYIGSTKVNEYSTNNGSGLIAPTVGVAYGAARGAWRLGKANADGPVFVQNDPGLILQNDGIGGFVNDGIGHTLATATSVTYQPGTSQIDFSAARGIIVPVSDADPQPMGVDSYTKDYFSFWTDGGISTITVNAGGQWLTPGVADPDASLDATLRILDALGNEVAVRNTASLSETLSLYLARGDYFIEVSSAGGKAASLGPNGNWDPASFFDMGSYFLTGVVAIPEPSTLTLAGLGALGLAASRACARKARKRNAATAEA